MTLLYGDGPWFFILFNKHEYTHGIFWSVILVSILQLYSTVSFSLETWLNKDVLLETSLDWQNQFWFSESSFSEKLASYWLLAFNVTSFFPMKISSLYWNGTVYTCKEQLWQKVTEEYPNVMMSILWKQSWFSYVRVSLKQEESYIYFAMTIRNCWNLVMTIRNCWKKINRPHTFRSLTTF